MKGRNWILTGLLLATLLLALAGPVNSQHAHAQDTLSRVRFLHAVPGAPSLDIYVNNRLAASGLAFGSVTPHLGVPSGDYLVTLRQSGTNSDTPALIEVSVPLAPNFAFTVVVQGALNALDVRLYEDILDEIQAGMARLTAINAVADAPPLDILNITTGGPLLQGINYGTPFGTVNIPVSQQNLALVPAGGAPDSAVAEAGNISLDSGTLYTILALGTIQGGVVTKVLATPVNGSGDSVQVQIAHGSPDSPAVDVYANDTLLVTALELGQMTGHIALPVGTYTVAVRPAGGATTDPTVATADVVFGSGMPPQTIAVLGQSVDETLTIQQFANNAAAVPVDKAVIGVVNTAPGVTATVGLSDSSATVLASMLGSNAQSAGVTVTPGKYMLTVNFEGIENPVSLVVPDKVYYGGMYYSVLVYGGGSAPYNASVVGTEFSVGIESLPLLPGQPAAVAVAPAPADIQPVPTQVPTVAPEVPADDSTELLPLATQAPPVPPPTQPNPVVVVQPTQPPAQQGELVVIQPTEAITEAPPQQPITQANPQPIGYVELNPGANLQCRELPGSDMRSLGLIPSGSTVTIIGRTGTPLVPETGNTTPEPTPVVETVEDLWLAIRWDPPGGGYVNCWVSAQFLRIEFRGKLLDELEELWELPEEPFNRPGEVVGADVSPPTPLFDAIIAKVELEPGISLQLRRYPQTDAESLGLVPAQAQLEVLGYASAPSDGLIGQPADPNWLYVRYRTENGGATIGWVSSQYVTLSRLGHSVEITDLVVVDVGEAGYYELPGQAPPIPIEQQDVIGVVNLNPGANLNLRDRPSADGIVVVGIPSGDAMVLNGRNGDGAWVQATYESAAGDLEGWVASQYLSITRGGQPWEIIDLPIVNDDEDTMTE